MVFTPALFRSKFEEIEATAEEMQKLEPDIVVKENSYPS
jgi:hypothetical protein